MSLYSTVLHFLFPRELRIPPCLAVRCWKSPPCPQLRCWKALYWGLPKRCCSPNLKALHCLAALARVPVLVQVRALAVPPHVLVRPANPPRSAHSSPPVTPLSPPHHTQFVVCFPQAGSYKAKLITFCKPYLSLPSRIFILPLCSKRTY